MNRRDFMKLSAAAAATMPVAGALARADDIRGGTGAQSGASHNYNEAYEGEQLNRVAFPLGGLGAGTVCIEGSGCLSHLSLRHRPEIFNEPGGVFSALWIKQTGSAHVLEGPVPGWKKFGLKGPEYAGSANGGGGTTWGLPRYTKAVFTSRFPFAEIKLTKPQLPVDVVVRAWSPFVPGESFNSSLPVAALEFTFVNTSAAPVDCVYSFNAKNFMSRGDGKLSLVETLPNGFTLGQKPLPDKPAEEGYFSVIALNTETKVNARWFRGGWFDALTMTWREIEQGFCGDRAAPTEGDPSPGASLMVPFSLAAGETKTVPILFSWYVPSSDLSIDAAPATNAEGKPTDPALRFYKPWYAVTFPDRAALRARWAGDYAELRAKTKRFTDCFYDTNLPPEVIEAVAANLSILKSPTVLRQRDGRLWAWEGCNDESGCCPGSCTHVWNYAQAIAHLFPDLERTFRQTEFGESQDERGDQKFRAALPIQPLAHNFHPAADGQLGGLMKVHRDWRISGDTEWLRGLWPKVKASLDYCIATWDPGHKGWVEEPHHNTYDIEFWGPDGMCTSIYLGALKAATLMGQALGDPVPLYSDLLDKGVRQANAELFDGEYFIQKVEWRNLRAKLNPEEANWNINYSSEARALVEKEGPKYQYGSGCLSDGVLGSWLALVCGVGQVLDADKVKSHLAAVHRHNLKKDLSEHANPQRPSYASGSEGGLLLCTWPKGGQLSLPFVYSNEVWTGIEYQVASHLMLMGRVDEGLEIVRLCRARYDGRIRNPFDEYECGHWYARALASYGLLQGLSGARYDAIEKVLYLQPSLRGDFRAFLSTATGFGTVGVEGGQPFCRALHGSIDVREIRYSAPAKSVA